MKPFKLPTKEKLLEEISLCSDEIAKATVERHYAYARQWQDRRRSAELALAKKLSEEKGE